MNRSMLKLVSALTLVALAAGCSSRNGVDEAEPSASPFGIARAALGQIVTERRSQGTPAPARSPDEMAAAALAANPGPLIMVGLEQSGTTQVRPDSVCACTSDSADGSASAVGSPPEPTS